MLKMNRLSLIVEWIDNDYLKEYEVVVDNNLKN